MTNEQSDYNPFTFEFAGGSMGRFTTAVTWLIFRAER
jgi:hypothetical protein